MAIPQMTLPDFLGSFNENRKIGENRGLAQLYGQAAQAPREQRPDMLAKMAGTSPEFAASARKEFDANDEEARTRLGQYAAAFDALPDEMKPQAYPQLARQAQEVGLPAPPEWNPAFAPHIQRLAQTLSGGKGAEPYTLSPGSRRYGPNNELLAEVPFAPASASIVNVPDGQGGSVQMLFDPKTRQLSEPQYPGQSQPQPTAHGQDGGAGMVLEDAVSSIVGPLGGRITSTTGGQHNPGSAHYSGNAIDIGMGRESPEQQQQILAALQGNPQFKVRDERTRPPGQAVWSGPHLHVERGQQSAQAGKLGYQPPKSAADKQTALQERIAAAREMGATDDEVRRMVIGREGAAAGAKPMPAAALRMVTDANSALKEVETVNSTLERIRAEIASDKLNLGPIRNVVNRGRVMAGFGNDESTRLSTTERSLRGLQNAALRLNKGVQTEGDAKRIWQELLGNLNDEASVLANIDRLMELNQRAQELHEMNLETVNGNYGRQQPSAQGQPANGPRRMKFNPQTGKIE